MDAAAVSSVSDYVERCALEFEAASAVPDSPDGFDKIAWSSFVQCVCDEKQDWYLSVPELLLVCELSRKNVGVFGVAGRSAKFLGSVTGFDDQTYTLVSLDHSDESVCMRSHFSRLHVFENAGPVAKDESSASTIPSVSGASQHRGKLLPRPKSCIPNVSSSACRILRSSNRTRGKKRSRGCQIVRATRNQNQVG